MRYNLRLLLILLAITPPLFSCGYQLGMGLFAEPVAELGELAEPIDTLFIKTAAEIAQEQAAEQAQWEEEKQRID